MDAYIFLSPTNQGVPTAATNLALRPKSCHQQLSLKQLAHNVHIDVCARPHRMNADKTGESLMAGELNSVQESIKLALDAADAATDASIVRLNANIKTGKKVSGSPLHHHYFCHRSRSSRCGAGVFRHTLF